MNVENEDEKRITVEILKRIFRCRSVKLEFLRRSGGSSTWRCTILIPEAEFAQETEKRYFVKTKISGPIPEEFIIERWRSNCMAKRHDVLSKHLGIYVCNNQSSERFERDLTKHCIHPLPDPGKKSIVIEIQSFLNGATLGEVLTERAQVGFHKKVDSHLAAKVCRAFAKVHNQRLEINQEVVYDESLQALLERFEKYVPSRIVHPIIDRATKLHMYGLGQELVDKWLHKSERLCALHGDLRCDNIILPDTSTIEGFAALIDFSRTPWGAAGYDCGRFVTDILEFYLQTRNEYYRLFIEEFISQYETLRNDPLFREELCLGVFPMLLIKLNPSGTPIEDLTIAKQLYEHCIKILEAGKFFIPQIAS